MASIIAKSRDLTGLPKALLPDAKEHIRIDGNYDDRFLTSALGRSIDLFERNSGISVFAVQWEWKPDAMNFCNGVAKVPVSPVGEWSAKDGAALDVSSGYSLVTMSTYGVGLYAFAGAWVDGLKFTLASGFTQPTLPYGILDAVLRCTAHLYEHREILTPGQPFATPGWFMDEIATYWVPRA